MIWIDYLLLIVVVVSLLAGLLRGLVRELISLAAWVLAFMLSLRFAPDVDAALQGSIHSPVIRYALSYASIFIGVLLLGALVSWVVTRIVRGIGLGGVDRILGASFGLARGAFIVIAAVLVAGGTIVKDEDWWRRSAFIPGLEPVAAEFGSLLPERWLAYLRPSPRAN